MPIGDRFFTVFDPSQNHLRGIDTSSQRGSAFKC